MDVSVATEADDPVLWSNILGRLWLWHYVGDNLTRARKGTLKPAGCCDRHLLCNHRLTASSRLSAYCESEKLQHQ